VGVKVGRRFTLGRRFKQFGLKINHSELVDLNRIRNEMEHFYTNATTEKVREAIARAFPVVVDLFKLLHEEPNKHLGGSREVIARSKVPLRQGTRGMRTELRERRLDVEQHGPRCSGLSGL
jgi:hypothetical protein